MNQLQQLISSTWGIVLTAFMGYVVWILKEQRQERKIENNKRNANAQGTRLVLFYMLQRLHTEYRCQGFVTYNQRRTFKEIYDAYHTLGGNGLGTKLWHDVANMEIRNEDIGLSLYARAYLEHTDIEHRDSLIYKKSIYKGGNVNEQD